MNNNKEVKKNLKKQMSKIRSLWDIYFLQLQSLHNKTWVPENTEFKYVGTILGNFIDTFDVIYDYEVSEKEHGNYSRNMSLMQAIFIQQDIMTELLRTFRTDVEKRDLWRDDNYSINREIRNELMGHPISIKNSILTSTTLIAYNGDSGCINYMRHHKDNNFEFEFKSYKVEEIIERHSNFILTYFQKIVDQIEVMMEDFVKKIKDILPSVSTIDFPQLLDFVDQNLESLYRQDFGYYHLPSIYELRDVHPRYSKLVDLFREEVSRHIESHLENIDEIFNPQPEEDDPVQKESLIEFVDGNIHINIQDDSSEVNTIEFEDRSFDYEVSKLIDNRALFSMSYNVLKKGLPDDELVHEELDHMAKNLDNDLEYYCSYRLIRNHLNLDNNF